MTGQIYLFCSVRACFRSNILIQRDLLDLGLNSEVVGSISCGLRSASDIVHCSYWIILIYNIELKFTAIFFIAGEEKYNRE
jgi:hypothetical protein